MCISSMCPVRLVRVDSERRKLQQIEVIGTEEKFIIQMSLKGLLIVASFDESSARGLRKELDEWLQDKSRHKDMFKFLRKR
jgi:hypothetical protein